MSSTATTAEEKRSGQGPKLARNISGVLLFFYVLGDVLGSGIYALIGLVADEVGGAFWTAFALGVFVALITGLAYAELVTRYPVAAGRRALHQQGVQEQLLHLRGDVLHARGHRHRLRRARADVRW